MKASIPSVAPVALVLAAAATIASTLAFVCWLQAEPEQSIQRDGSWERLSAAEQTALQPLRALWPSMNDARRQKWVLIAARLHTLSTHAQTRLRSRMAHWAAMTPQERAAARIGYLRVKSLGSKAAGAAVHSVAPGLIHVAPGATTVLMDVPASRKPR
jgi:hypothetical protein